MIELAMRFATVASVCALAAMPCAALAQAGAGAFTSAPAPYSAAMADDGRSVVLGRYDTQSSEPPPDLVEPMDTVVALTFPRQVVRTVDEAVQYALLRTGYRFEMSDAGDAARVFLDLPLPESQRQIGPYSVRSVLTVLMGTAWKPQINAADRTVRMVSRAPAASPAPTPKATTTVAATPVPKVKPGANTGPDRRAAQRAMAQQVSKGYAN